MADAARVLDDVSEDLGAVLRRADELLADWSRFGDEVRAQVEREAAALGQVVDAAVARAAGAGVERAIADRLRAVTVELERLEQRTRVAARAAAEQRVGDRRILWAVVGGVVLANALLVALLLRAPAPAPRDAPPQLAPPVAPAASSPSEVAPSPAAPAPDAVTPGGGSAEIAPAGAPGPGGAAPSAGSAAPTKPTSPVGRGAGSADATPPAARAPAASPGASVHTNPASGSAAPHAPSPAASVGSSVSLPPRGGPRVHKKQP